MAIGDCGHLRAKWSKSHMSRQPELAVANECFLAGQDDIKANLITKSNVIYQNERLQLGTTK
jgi:hypothetical protein